MSWSQTVFDGPAELAIACAVVFLGQLIYLMLGFGAGMLAVGTLTVFLPDVRDAVVLLLLLTLPSEIWVVTASRRHIRWSGIGLLVGGVLLGVPLGSWMLRWWDTHLLLLGLGGLLVAAGTAFLFLPDRARVQWPAGVAPATGVLAGVLGGLFGTSGPPLALYFHLAPGGKTAFRGHLMAVFLAMTSLRVPMYAALGLFTSARLLSAVLLLPASVLGAVAGHALHVRSGEGVFRRAVAAGLLGLGIILLQRG